MIAMTAWPVRAGAPDGRGAPDGTGAPDGLGLGDLELALMTTDDTPDRKSVV